MKNRWMILALLMASGCMRPVFAQQSTPIPQLTELESTKLENFELKLAMLNQQAQPFLKGKSELIRKIISEHPGYTWHEAQRPGDMTGLVAIPKPEPAKHAPTATLPAGPGTKESQQVTKPATPESIPPADKK